MLAITEPSIHNALPAILSYNRGSLQFVFRRVRYVLSSFIRYSLLFPIRSILPVTLEIYRSTRMYCSRDNILFFLFIRIHFIDFIHTKLPVRYFFLAQTRHLLSFVYFFIFFLVEITRYSYPELIFSLLILKSCRTIYHFVISYLNWNKMCDE